MDRGGLAEVVANTSNGWRGLWRYVQFVTNGYGSPTDAIFLGKTSRSTIKAKSLAVTDCSRVVRLDKIINDDMVDAQCFVTLVCLVFGL